MLVNAPSVERLVEAFRRLPGIGKRTAERLALHLLSAPDDEAAFLSAAIQDARDRVRRCSICCNLTEQDPCPICADARRDHAVVCVTERPAGVMAIEKGAGYRGVYHVLHGALDPLEGVGPSELTLDRLLQRLHAGAVREVILATNATTQGEATALYVSRQIAPWPDVAVTRIAHGVPMGSGLECADDVTLAHALDGRKPV